MLNFILVNLVYVFNQTALQGLMFHLC